MNLFVDTSVWSLALRRDSPPQTGAVRFLAGAITGGANLFTTGLVLQELLQGFSGPRAREVILKRFSALPFVVPDRDDHVQAADLRNLCRRKGVQVGTIDVLLAQICIRRGLQLLTEDQDFRHMSQYCEISLAEY